ncbi:MAG: site-2 protease family protein [Planctomycetes bacterium]|nr:site-2 protease family protein [Planctomycetota bacterium]
MLSIGYILLALVGFGFVVFIHELGHFVFAKWAGVKVEVFSIGFGPKILTRRIGETEYALSLLPFGGYVKMLGQDDNPAGERPPGPGDAIDPRSFLAASPGWKALILLGGVLFNLISSYAILITLAFTGMPMLRPMVGGVEQQIVNQKGERVPSPASRLGLRVGDLVTEMNGERVRSFDDIFTEAVVSAQQPVRLTVKRRGVDQPLTLGDGVITPAYSRDRGLAVLGMVPSVENRIDMVEAAGDDPANPELGERVVAIDGRDLTTIDPPLNGQEIIESLAMRLGTPIGLTLEKDGKRRDTRIVYAGEAASGTMVGFPTVLFRVIDGTPAHAAGLLAGDVIISVDGTPIAEVSQLLKRVREQTIRGQPCRITVWRESAVGESNLRDVVVHGTTIDGQPRIGVEPRALTRGRLPVLPLLPDAIENPLAKAGIAVGDTIIAPLPPADGDKANRLRFAVLSGGERVLVPISEVAFTALLDVQAVPKLQRWIGAKAAQSLAEQLLGARVVAGLDAGDGKGPSGSLSSGYLTVRKAAPMTAQGKAPAPYVDARALVDLVPDLFTTLRVDDWIVGVVASPAGLALEILRGAEGEPRSVQVERGVAIGFDHEEVPYRIANASEAFEIVNTTSYNMVVKTLQLIPRFFRSAESGGINPNKSLTGPIGIFTQLKQRAEHFGIASYLKFLALIGLNLFLVNLLPIPITDGGQLVFLGIETAMRRPLPVMVRVVAAWIGYVLVIGLMLYVCGLDLSRYLPG